MEISEHESDIVTFTFQEDHFSYHGRLTGKTRNRRSGWKCITTVQAGEKNRSGNCAEPLGLRTSTEISQSNK